MSPPEPDHPHDYMFGCRREECIAYARGVARGFDEAHAASERGRRHEEAAEELEPDRQRDRAERVVEGRDG